MALLLGWGPMRVRVQKVRVPVSRSACGLGVVIIIILERRVRQSLLGGTNTGFAQWAERVAKNGTVCS